MYGIGPLMEERPGIVERAFQIAKGGTVPDIFELHKQLAKEGYSDSAQYLAGRAITNQLKRSITERSLRK